MGGRRANGEGTIYPRKDGRWEGAVYLLTGSGTRKRLRVYGTTRGEVHARLTDAKAKEQQGIPMPDKAWKLSAYLDYWLEEVIRPNRRPTTYDLYESNVRLYLKPSLGHLSLTRLSVRTVQTFLNRQRAEGHSINKLHKLREVLGSALGQAMHEELVSRNVAWRVKLPSEQRGKISPWTFEEVTGFLDAAKTHRWHAAFTLIAFYGLRRGEVLGLRWCDVKFTTSELHIRQQVFRAGGRLQQGPVKTAAGQRELPLRAFVRESLVTHQAHQVAAQVKAGAAWRGSKGPEELVFTTPDGGMVEPQNFSRSFQRLCARHKLRRIKLHHVRHTTNTLLKMLGVQPRDRQLILGHSNVQTTQQLYEHDNMQWRNESLGRLERALSSDQNDGHQDEVPGDPAVAETTSSRQDSARCRQISRQTLATPSLRAQINSGLAAKNRPATGVSAASWLDNFLGDLTGNRTRIARMRSQNIQSSDGVQDRLTTVSSTMQEWGRQWKFGIVAVNLAVKRR